MEVRVRMFGLSADLAGCREVSITIPCGTSVEELMEVLADRFVQLGPHLQQLAVAVNRRRAGSGETLKPGDEVALLPPVSGGEFGVTHEPLSADRVQEAVTGPGIGAVSVFVGTVREITDHKRTAYLFYEAYEEMAAEELRRIGTEIEKRWPGSKTAIIHRLGQLLPGEASVVIAVGTPHRPAAFAACREAIELLKQRVPVWKKEVYADGSEEWVVPGKGDGDGGQ